MSTTINQIQDQLIEEFELFENDWDAKYDYIIDMGKKLQGLPDEVKTDSNKIKGCQSNVWLTSNVAPDGRIQFEGDSDAIIVKGLVAMLIRVMSGHGAQEIANADLYFIEKIGLSRHLAQTRSNGLLSMVKQMKFYGLAYGTQENTIEG
jgi:cysteine desulfuration protein SufE